MRFFENKSISSKKSNWQKHANPMIFQYSSFLFIFVFSTPVILANFSKLSLMAQGWQEFKGSIFYPNMWKWKQWILKQILHEHSTYSFLFLATNNPLHKRSFNTNIMNLLRLKQFSLPSHTRKFIQLGKIP